MMNPEFKAKWVAALRSGAYQQTTGSLRKPAGFCCLGVACDVNDPSGWVSSWPFEYSFGGKGVRACTIPTPLLEKICLSREQEAYLMNMNDSGSSFAEIADHIEATL